MAKFNRYKNGNERRKQRKRLRGMYTHCPVCGVALDWEHPYLPNSAEVDEIYPVSKVPQELKLRAVTDPRNLQVLCRRCNKAKGDKIPLRFLKSVDTVDNSQPVKTSRKWQ